IEAMRQAQLKRTENLKKMKELKEKTDKDAEKVEKERLKEAEKAKPKAIIDKYEAEKKRVAEEKRLARLAKKPVVKPQPKLPQHKSPAAIANEDTWTDTFVEFDPPDDDFMGIFG
ncbi:hypothetical protein HDU89_001354, partial [Geranomyces variabilis]